MVSPSWGAWKQAAASLSLVWINRSSQAQAEAKNQAKPAPRLCAAPSGCSIVRDRCLRWIGIACGRAGRSKCPFALEPKPNPSLNEAMEWMGRSIDHAGAGAQLHPLNPPKAKQAI